MKKSVIDILREITNNGKNEVDYSDDNQFKNPDGTPLNRDEMVNLMREAIVRWYYKTFRQHFKNDNAEPLPPDCTSNAIDINQDSVAFQRSDFYRRFVLEDPTLLSCASDAMIECVRELPKYYKCLKDFTDGSLIVIKNKMTAVGILFLTATQPKTVTKKRQYEICDGRLYKINFLLDLMKSGYVIPDLKEYYFNALFKPNYTEGAWVSSNSMDDEEKQEDTSYLAKIISAKASNNVDTVQNIIDDVTVSQDPMIAVNNMYSYNGQMFFHANRKFDKPSTHTDKTPFSYLVSQGPGLLTARMIHRLVASSGFKNNPTTLTFIDPRVLGMEKYLKKLNNDGVFDADSCNSYYIDDIVARNIPNSHSYLAEKSEIEHGNYSGGIKILDEFGIQTTTVICPDNENNHNTDIDSTYTIPNSEDLSNLILQDDFYYIKPDYKCLDVDDYIDHGFPTDIQKNVLDRVKSPDAIERFDDRLTGQRNFKLIQDQRVIEKLLDVKNVADYSTESLDNIYNLQKGFLNNEITNDINHKYPHGQNQVFYNNNPRDCSFSGKVDSLEQSETYSIIVYEKKGEENDSFTKKGELVTSNQITAGSSKIKDLEKQSSRIECLKRLWFLYGKKGEINKQKDILTRLLNYVGNTKNFSKMFGNALVNFHCSKERNLLKIPSTDHGSKPYYTRMIGTEGKIVEIDDYEFLKALILAYNKMPEDNDQQKRQKHTVRERIKEVVSSAEKIEAPILLILMKNKLIRKEDVEYNVKRILHQDHNSMYNLYFSYDQTEPELQIDGGFDKENQYLDMKMYSDFCEYYENIKNPPKDKDGNALFECGNGRDLTVDEQNKFNFAENQKNIVAQALKPDVGDATKDVIDKIYEQYTDESKKVSDKVRNTFYKEVCDYLNVECATDINDSKAVKKNIEQLRKYLSNVKHKDNITNYWRSDGGEKKVTTDNKGSVYGADGLLKKICLLKSVFDSYSRLSGVDVQSDAKYRDDINTIYTIVDKVDRTGTLDGLKIAGDDITEGVVNDKIRFFSQKIIDKLDEYQLSIDTLMGNQSDNPDLQTLKQLFNGAKENVVNNIRYPIFSDKLKKPGYWLSYDLPNLENCSNDTAQIYNDFIEQYNSFQKKKVLENNKNIVNGVKNDLKRKIEDDFGKNIKNASLEYKKNHLNGDNVARNFFEKYSEVLKTEKDAIVNAIDSYNENDAEALTSIVNKNYDVLHKKATAFKDQIKQFNIENRKYKDNIQNISASNLYSNDKIINKDTKQLFKQLHKQQQDVNDQILNRKNDDALGKMEPKNKKSFFFDVKQKLLTIATLLSCPTVLAGQFFTKSNPIFLLFAVPCCIPVVIALLRKSNYNKNCDIDNIKAEQRIMSDSFNATLKIPSINMQPEIKQTDENNQEQRDNEEQKGKLNVVNNNNKNLTNISSDKLGRNEDNIQM